MVSRDEGRYVIWPVYFDASLTRLEGRKIPKKYAIEKPTTETIAKAAKSLGLNPIIEKQSAHPSAAWKKDGRVIVDKKGPKSTLLIQIAHRI